MTQRWWLAAGALALALGVTTARADDGPCCKDAGTCPRRCCEQQQAADAACEEIDGPAIPAAPGGLLRLFFAVHQGPAVRVGGGDVFCLIRGAAVGTPACPACPADCVYRVRLAPPAVVHTEMVPGPAANRITYQFLAAPPPVPTVRVQAAVPPPAPALPLMVGAGAAAGLVTPPVPVCAPPPMAGPVPMAVPCPPMALAAPPVVVCPPPAPALPLPAARLLEAVRKAATCPPGVYDVPVVTPPPPPQYTVPQYEGPPPPPVLLPAPRPAEYHSALKVEAGKGEMHLKVRGSDLADATCKDLTLKLAGGASLKLKAHEGQIHVEGPSFEATASRLSRVGNGDVVLEGAVKLKYHKDGLRADVEAERVLVGLGDGRLEIKPGVKAVPATIAPVAPQTFTFWQSYFR